MSYTTRKMKSGRIELRKQYSNGIEIRIYPKSDGTYHPHIYFEELSKGKVKFLKSLTMNVSKASYTKGTEMQATFKKNVIKSFKEAIETARSLEMIVEMLLVSIKANEYVNSFKK